MDHRARDDGETSRPLRRAWNAMPEPLKDMAHSLVLGPRAISLMPAMTLVAFWTGGESLMLGFAALVPAVAVVLSWMAGGISARGRRDGLTALMLREGVAARLEAALSMRGRSTACLVVEIDEFRRVVERLGSSEADEVMRRVAERVVLTCRAGDSVGRLGGAAFAVALAPVRRADLEVALQVAERLQAAVAEPVLTAGSTVHLTASVGICLPSRAPRPGGAALIDAAERAASEARRGGPARVRAFTGEIERKLSARHALIDAAHDALRDNHIVPWFQPQLCTDTGTITGFEALARWVDPERGVIPPGEFLPALEQVGLMERLGETMLHQALSGLRSWDRAGLTIPTVGVNFSPEELRNPNLVERVHWELDGFELAPSRLSIEVLETVVAGDGDEVIVRNLLGLAELGCRIDLDDFGTGHASIGAIRRFPIARVKIDRSFVAGIDTDPEQHRMVSAILGMAERLGLETLAEGVETPAQHTILSQLGCGHVQGFGIAKPMSFDDAVIWAARLANRVDATPPIPRRTG